MPPTESIRDIAVGLFIFNRLEEPLQVIDALRVIRPNRLYLISDGPRSDRQGERVLVEEVRRVVEAAIDWPCDVTKDYATRNLGCRDRIITGITRVFEEEEFLIILEDDCVPSVAFFSFVAAMRHTYQDNVRVFSISGSCFLDGNHPTPSHYLSDYSLMWGWATWRDRWKNYDPAPTGFRRICAKKFLPNALDFAYWYSVFKRIESGALESAWDYQWILTHWRHDAKSVRPLSNLVKNIGFGENATHTKGPNRFAFLASPADNLSFTVSQDITGSPLATLANNADKRSWAMINWRTVLLLTFPILKRLKRNN